MAEQDNPQLKLANDFVRYTNVNIFLTGKAGTGKTTFLKKLKENSPKRMIVTAPTGVAAINAGGVTIHSFFQLPFGPQILRASDDKTPGGNSIDINRFSKEKINIIKSLDLLIIDEISMVRSDLLDAVDRVLRRYRKKNLPFGGVQLLMIGDLQQLSPVVKDEEKEILRQYYETPYFFSSLALKKTKFVSIELQHIYRQSDNKFIDLLNKIRENKIDKEATELLNSRYIPDFMPDKKEGYITLTTHNQQADKINFIKMNHIDKPIVTFEAEISGVFPESSYPNELNLGLKEGAQVMFVKNDISHEKLYYNGKIGEISSIEDGIVYVKCPGEDYEIPTEPVEWHNYTYTINKETEEITETLIGTFRQIPLKPAWAITIHKSQGLTFEKAIIDANAAFAHGQIYVALSRCTNLGGMVLSSRIDSCKLKCDASIDYFMKDIEINQPDEKIFLESKKAYERALLFELNDFSTIKSRLAYCSKLAKENESSLLQSLSDVCNEASGNFESDLVDISHKFEHQLDRLLNNNPDAEKNEMLQERLIKACRYYEEKAERIFPRFFDRFNIETDNKTVRKTMREALDRLEEEYCIKIACLNEVKSGFTISSYLETKAKACIEKKTSSKKEKISAKTEKEKISEEIPNPELFTILREWRKQNAEELNVPAYIIITQKSILQMASHMPRNISQLKMIKGIGDKKASQYGNEILEIISDFCRNNPSGIT